MTATLTPAAVSKSKRAMLIEQLYREEGKAEIINGKVVRMSPAAAWHGKASLRIGASLDAYELQVGGGHAFGDNVEFLVELPNRDSFSPDAAWHCGKFPQEKDSFLVGAPTFAVEVRSISQYGPAEELKILEKIREYFQAGTLVVWDVDQLREGWVKRYTPGTIDNPQAFKRGDTADAEPAVPGWRMAVDRILVNPSTPLT